MAYKDKEKKALSNARYRDNHRGELLEEKRTYRQLKVMCACGKEVSRNYLSQHLKVKQHHKLVDKESQERKKLLENKTNTDITNLILSF